ncbi:beta-ketoacyl synthase N-terminal-like domain-containing protein [Methylocucumis oryzae]|uniref:beta-ketoacyl synthase N-terminal-like domain-containing protein n=1 Tax=Methylocucumis oryzae TaxID=1632867 RepID=UPI00069833F6|nr:beta-ketoacyl synthase N-terminal-like domain-containing protein [Methylocucumis oryzae]
MLSINTACSSSLVALHQACLSLRNHECDAALAAGVNLMIAPEAYIAMSQAGMLAPDGQCRAFAADANGIVPGEAVVVLVLKRLSRAKADGDSIHAIIAGSGVNYDGKTNGITAPSALAQTELIQTVLTQAQVKPSEISYIVTHGTGTPLGDPVEINALNDAFTSTTERQFCAITSAKTNFGHAFAASGLLSVVNLIQALRHETIPANLHCASPSAYVDWHNTPFYINTHNQPWPKASGQARFGAVSSFGMSGTNAHVLIRDAELCECDSDSLPYYVLVVSAKSREALTHQIAAMRHYLANETAEQQGLYAISHTLLTGRHHFQYRSAIVVQSLDDALRLWQNANTAHPHYFTGQVARDFNEQKAMQKLIAQLVQQCVTEADADAYKDALLALAECYCQGYRIDWAKLYAEKPPRRVHLPGYAFERQCHWAPTSVEKPEPVVRVNVSEPLSRVVNMTHSPQVNKDRPKQDVLTALNPGFNYLELARTAAETAVQQPVLALKNMVWGPPMSVSGAVSDINVSLHQAQQQMMYKIVSPNQPGLTRHVGEVILDLAPLPSLLTQGSEPIPDSKTATRSDASFQDFIHKILTAQSNALEGLQDVYVNGSAMSALLSLPEHEPAKFNPLCLDAVWQLLLYFCQPPSARRGQSPSEIVYPFALKQILQQGELSGELLIHLKQKPSLNTLDKRFDVVVMDGKGQVRLHLQELAARKREGLMELRV